MLSISGLSVLAYAGWWWVTWPDRTANRFATLISTEEGMEAALTMMGRQEEWQEGGIYVVDPRVQSNIEPQPRTPWDIVTGVRVYRIALAPPHGWSFRVVRGHVENDS
jgi:hypothetical protein